MEIRIWLLLEGAHFSDIRAVVWLAFRESYQNIMFKRFIIAIVVVMAVLSLTQAVLEPCIGKFECAKSWMRCTNLEYVGTPKQYDYTADATMGFVCLPLPDY